MPPNDTHNRLFISSFFCFFHSNLSAIIISNLENEEKNKPDLQLRNIRKLLQTRRLGLRSGWSIETLSSCDS